MPTRIEVLPRIDDIDRERWHVLQAESGAPAFYGHTFLSAFERFPLHPVEARAYVVGVESDGSLRCGLPLYLQRGVDPMRVLDRFLPARRDERLLLSPVWHCYQGVAPVLGPDDLLWDQLLGAASETAERLGARGVGFLNVEADGPLDCALRTRGFGRVETDRKLSLDLGGFSDVDDYVEQLGRSARQSMRRYARIAEDAGLVLQTVAPADADLDRMVVLARQTAAKFDNAGFYEPGRFQRFVESLESVARIIEIRHGDRLICSTILLLDGRSVHFWVCATDPELNNRFSPFRLALREAVRFALARGAETLEAGRRNEAFKQRHGLRPTPLLTCMSPSPK